MGGGGLEFLLVANFFYLRKKTIFFCDERPTISFLIFVETEIYIFVVCLSFYVRYHLVFSSILKTNFFLTPFSTDFKKKKISTPPSRYQMVRPSDGLVCQPDSSPLPA